MSCLISFERCQSSCEEHGTSEHYKNLVHGRIRTTNTARPSDYKSIVNFSQYQINVANFNLGDDNVILRRGGGGGVNLIGTDYQFSAQARDRPYQKHNFFFQLQHFFLNST